VDSVIDEELKARGLSLNCLAEKAYFLPVESEDEKIERLKREGKTTELEKYLYDRKKKREEREERARQGAARVGEGPSGTRPGPQAKTGYASMVRAGREDQLGEVVVVPADAEHSGQQGRGRGRGGAGDRGRGIARGGGDRGGGGARGRGRGDLT